LGTWDRVDKEEGENVQNTFVEIKCVERIKKSFQVLGIICQGQGTVCFFVMKKKFNISYILKQFGGCNKIGLKF
jgi:hypothetical protein